MAPTLTEEQELIYMVKKQKLKKVVSLEIYTTVFQIDIYAIRTIPARKYQKRL